MSRDPIVLESDLSGRSFPGARRRPWTWLLAGAVLVVVLDLLIALARPSPPPEPPLADDLPRARQALARAAEHVDAGAESWLLLGDSVLAGDVMRQALPDAWAEHRVLDYLRREQAPEARVGFEQLALDGLLPVDMLRIVRELDVLDPAGRVGVVLELDPRFFSGHYAEQETCSREFLCELGEAPQSPRALAWMTVLGHQAWQWLDEHLPLWRHRELFPHLDAERQGELLPRHPLEGQTPEAGADPLLGRARVLEHYRKLVANGKSAQYRALVSVVERLRARERRALLFATPLDDREVRGVLDGQAYGRYIGTLDRLVNRPGDTRVRFASLDHPSLPDGSFIDHVHLRPEGNRWLAINLLHQLGVGLASVPPRGLLAYEEGPDRSLLARVDRGNREGAPWQATLEHPEGIAVAPGGGWVVVADTGNHCVRELVGPLTTLRTLAGACGRKGGKDGKPRKGAKLHAPRWPVLIGERVYVVDGEAGNRLREITEAKVRTIKPKGDVEWGHIVTMRGDDHELWLVDEGTRILRVDPRTGHARVRFSDPEVPLVALDVGPDGRLYFADERGRLWQLSPGQGDPVLLFANDAPELMPQDEGDYFPFGFDELAFDRVVDLRYVDRYDALLVVDEHQATARAKEVTERVHLRLVSPRERKIYPWVHPLVHGGGQVFHNRPAGTLAGYLHRGSMALDQGSATLFWVESERTRLLALGDGLFGTAKLGHHVTPTAYGGFKDVFGLEAGQSTMLAHHPERWAHHRLEPLPRRGPYLGLFLGSSMTSVTEVVGQYSLARVMERELVHALGVRDGLRFDLVQRAFRGPRLDRLVSTFESFVEHQAPVDVVFIEVRSGRTLGKYKDENALVPMIDRIRRAAERYDTQVVIVDNDAMTAGKRDGLRASSRRLRQFLDLCEAAGFVVLRPGDLLLREAIDHAPWGNAPFRGTHGSTWAMDLTGETLASLAYPELREHLRGRVPVLLRPRVEAVARGEPLYKAFGGRRARVAKRARDVPSEALQRNLEGSRLELLVDLGKLHREGELTPKDADALVLAYLVEAILRDPAGRLASTVDIALARFGNYDEYGVGVLEAAEIVERREYDRAGLEAFIDAMGTAR